MAKPPRPPSHPPPRPRPPAGPASPPPPAGPRHHRRWRLGTALIVLGGALAAAILARPIAWLDDQIAPWLLVVGLAAWALFGAALQSTPTPTPKARRSHRWPGVTPNEHH